MKKIYVKKISIFLCLLVLTALVGCNNKNSSVVSKSEDNNSNTTSKSEEYVWTKLNQNVKITSYGQRSNRDYNNNYYVSTLTFDPLCNEENIASIEYYLENIDGTFMDPNKTDPYANDVKRAPYLLNGSNQEGIYFSIYYNFDINITNQQEVEVIGGLIEKSRIRLTVAYNDGSVKIRNFAIKLASKYNYRNLDMYELTLAE